MGGVEVDPGLVRQIGALCAALPEVVEEDAWHGVRWRVRGKTFAHVLEIVDGRPAGYAEAAGGEGAVLTFRVTAAERDLFSRLGPPYWATHWGRDVGGLFLDDATDWSEVAELITDSYRLMAPQKLVQKLVQQPTERLPDPISGPRGSLAE